ncbi:DAHL domain-containing protein [Ensifer adhaerens]
MSSFSSRTWLPILLILAAILLAIIAAGRSPAGQAHEAAITALRTIDLAHASLQRDVLRARAGLLRSYDSIVVEIETLRSNVSALRARFNEAEIYDAELTPPLR